MWANNDPQSENVHDPRSGMLVLRRAACRQFCTWVNSNPCKIWPKATPGAGGGGGEEILETPPTNTLRRSALRTIAPTKLPNYSKMMPGSLLRCFLTRRLPNSASMSPMFPRIGQHWPKFTRFGQVLPECGHLAQSWPMCVNCSDNARGSIFGVRNRTPTDRLGEE